METSYYSSCLISPQNDRCFALAFSASFAYLYASAADSWSKLFLFWCKMRSASVLDIKMIEPNTDKFKMQGGIGLVSNRLLAEIPVIKEKLSVMVAGRLSINDFMFKWFAPDYLKNIRANFLFG